VFLGNTPRPTAGERIFQSFRLSRVFERIPHDCLNQIEGSGRDTALVFDPKPEVWKKLGLKYGDPFGLSLERTSLFTMRSLSRICASPPLRGEAPKANGAHSEGSGAGERSP
jgi:hypothetical protein